MTANGSDQLNYEDLLEEAQNEGLIVKEKPLIARDGLINGRRVAIRQNIPLVQKICALAEEIGHYKKMLVILPINL